MIFQNCTVYITVADPDNIKITQETRAVATKPGETSIIIKKQDPGHSPAASAFGEAVTKPSVAVHDPVPIGYEHNPNATWITTCEAASLFGRSVTFFWSLPIRAPHLAKKRGRVTLLNKELTKKWLDEHPEVFSMPKLHDTGALVDAAVEILKRDVRELRGYARPGALRSQFYTTREMAKKLNISVSKFNEIRPLVIKKLMEDQEYLSLIKNRIDVEEIVPEKPVTEDIKKEPEQFIAPALANDIEHVLKPAAIHHDDIESEWLSVREAARLFNFSEIFIYQIGKQNLNFLKKDTIHFLINKKALTEYFESHPEHKKNQKQRKGYSESVEDLVNRAIEILRQDKKEMYPETGVSRAMRSNYYTYQEVADKLRISYSFFNMKVRPVLCQKIKSDTPYLNMVQATRAKEKEDIDNIVERCIEILDREGKQFRSQPGCVGSENYMTAKELAEKLSIPYMTFILKIKPYLEGEINETGIVDSDRKINDWKKNQVSVV